MYAKNEIEAALDHSSDDMVISTDEEIDKFDNCDEKKTSETSSNAINTCNASANSAPPPPDNNAPKQLNGNGNTRPIQTESRKRKEPDTEPIPSQGSISTLTLTSASTSPPLEPPFKILKHDLIPGAEVRLPTLAVDKENTEPKDAKENGASSPQVSSSIEEKKTSPVDLTVGSESNINAVQVSHAKDAEPKPAPHAEPEPDAEPDAEPDFIADPDSTDADADADAEMQSSDDGEDGGDLQDCDAAFRSMVNLDPVPATPPLEKLNPRELSQLELALQIGEKFADHADYTTWREDWNGNLQLVDKDLIMNREELARDPELKKITIQFVDYVAKLARHSDDFTGIRLLFSFVYNMKGTPAMAQKILAYYLQRPAASVSERLQFIMDASRRISYDPAVLSQDGWTTVKSDAPDGHTGGSFLIGRRVIWHGFEAIVIAFVRDEDIGDLWKCFWIEDHDTFDLEADELQEGMKKWDKKIAKRKPVASLPKPARPSIRFEANRNFSVDDIEDGIILAKSYKSKSGRPWPARVMHVTEVKASGNQLGSRRSSSRNSAVSPIDCPRLSPP